MKRSSVVCVMIADAGCGKKEDKNLAAATADQAPRTADGGGVIPPDSPKLQQLHVEPVRTAQVPTDEVISPGKIEANPGGISRVGLPEPGRISSALDHLGDARRKGH